MEHRCEVCGKRDCQTLYGKLAYNGNKDDRYMCEKCYKEIHGEEPCKD